MRSQERLHLRAGNVDERANDAEAPDPGFRGKPAKAHEPAPAQEANEERLRRVIGRMGKSDGICAERAPCSIKECKPFRARGHFKALAGAPNARGHVGVLHDARVSEPPCRSLHEFRIGIRLSASDAVVQVRNREGNG